MDQFLNHVVTINLIFSFFLVIQVMKHYIFFSIGQHSILKQSIRRVFLADFLMGMSVVLYNFMPQLTGEFRNTLDIELILKLIQTISIVYALYANFKLFMTLRSIED